MRIVGMIEPVELAARLLEDSATYFETLYKRHNIHIIEQGIDPEKLRSAAAVLRCDEEEKCKTAKK
jgi:hypothetical protein